MYAGSARPTKPRQCGRVDRPRPAAGTHVGDQHRSHRPVRSRPTVTANSTPSCAASTASISPSSIRNPRIFTWKSLRPRYSTSHRRALPAHQVAGAVHPVARLAERVRRRTVPRSAGPVVVSAGRARPRRGTAHRDPDRHRPQPRVQHRLCDAADRAADRDRRRRRQRVADVGHDRGLGRPVAVEQRGGRRPSGATSSGGHASPPATTSTGSRRARPGPRRQRGGRDEARA